MEHPRITMQHMAAAQKRYEEFASVAFDRSAPEVMTDEEYEASCRFHLEYLGLSEDVFARLHDGANMVRLAGPYAVFRQLMILAVAYTMVVDELVAEMNAAEGAGE